MALLSLIRKTPALFAPVMRKLILALPLALQPNFASAVELTSHPECLDTLFEIQKAIHKNRNAYELKAKSLKEKLPENCKKLPFEISSRNKIGYRFVLEWRGQVWQINENNEIVHLRSKAVADEKNISPSPATPAVAVDAPVPLPTPLPAGAPPPRAVLATPLISARSISLPQLTPTETLSPAEKTQSCYAKSRFTTTECSEHFEQLEARCKAEAGSRAELCNAFDKAVNSATLDNCDDANYGRCQIHIRRLQKKCSQPLAQINSECVALTAFLATHNPDSSPSETKGRTADRKPSAICSRDDRQTCAVEYCRKATNAGATKDDLQLCTEAQGVQSNKTSSALVSNVRPMHACLSDIKRLRPVTFDWKKSRLTDIGFVAEDVASTNPDLVVYDDQGRIASVKYAQISALLTGAMQELQARTAAIGDESDGLQRRVKALESVNARLQQENMDLRRQLERLVQDLERVKTKTGITD